MSEFEVRIGGASIDPTRHVHYTTDMVLGVDEFVQDFGYLAGHDRWICRALAGAGTLSGLHVHMAGEDGLELVVAAGVALGPGGALLRLDRDHCVRLDDWLVGRAPSLNLQDGDVLELFVTLQLHEALTDELPLPGAPCRTDDDVLVPTRIIDRAELRLELEAPEPLRSAEAAEFALWLARRLAFDEDAAGAVRSRLLDAVRGRAWREAGDDGTVGLSRQDANGDLAAAIRVYVTEVQPQLDERAGWIGPEPAERLLLAAIRFPVEIAEGVARIALDALEVDPAKRPIVEPPAVSRILAGASALSNLAVAEIHFDDPAGPVLARADRIVRIASTDAPVRRVHLELAHGVPWQEGCVSLEAVLDVGAGGPWFCQRIVGAELPDGWPEENTLSLALHPLMEPEADGPWPGLAKVQVRITSLLPSTP